MNSIELSKELGGKIEIKSKQKLTAANLPVLYTPGVAEVSKAIAKNKNLAGIYTIKKNTVAVITDGSAVLGLGNIGPEAALPVMEGKCLLFKELAGVDAFPIVLNTQDTEEIIKTIKNIAPGFGGINLEDISAPRCFLVEDALQDLGIPVMHDDQHGTAVVVFAALINAAKVVEKDLKSLKIVISGAGAAGSAVAKLLSPKVADILVLDSKGLIYDGRQDLDIYKQKLAKITNKKAKSGNLQNALTGADVFIGLSKGNLMTAEEIKLMNKKAIVFAMANPIPEIMPDEAKKGGALVIATGRSDYPNQINNVLAFPGIFKGALKVRAIRITEEMKLAASYALANLVFAPTSQKIIPDPLDKRVVKVVSEAVANVWGLAKKSAES